MYSSTSQPQVAISADGDLLIIQGPAQPALFVPRQLIGAFLTEPRTAPAVLIVDVGLAAIRAVVAAKATFDADTRLSDSGQIQSVTLRFRLPNGLVVGFTTDDVLAADSAKIHSLGIDLIVTNDAIDWQRQHTGFVGQVISSVATVPPQVLGVIPAHSQELKAQIYAALHKAGFTTSTPIPNE